MPLPFLIIFDRDIAGASPMYLLNTDHVAWYVLTHLDESDASHLRINTSCFFSSGGHHVTRGLRKINAMMRTCRLELKTASASDKSATAFQTYFAS